MSDVMEAIGLKRHMQPVPGAEHWRLGPAADSEVDWEAESGPVDDGRTVYTLLSRPLPPYVLEHFFSRHGKVRRIVSLMALATPSG